MLSGYPFDSAFILSCQSPPGEDGKRRKGKIGLQSVQKTTDSRAPRPSALLRGGIPVLTPQQIIRCTHSEQSRILPIVTPREGGKVAGGVPPLVRARGWRRQTRRLQQQVGGVQREHPLVALCTLSVKTESEGGAAARRTKAPVAPLRPSGIKRRRRCHGKGGLRGLSDAQA